MVISKVPKVEVATDIDSDSELMSALMITFSVTDDYTPTPSSVLKTKRQITSFFFSLHLSLCTSNADDDGLRLVFTPYITNKNHQHCTIPNAKAHVSSLYHYMDAPPERSAE